MITITLHLKIVIIIIWDRAIDKIIDFDCVIEKITDFDCVIDKITPCLGFEALFGVVRTSELLLVTNSAF